MWACACVSANSKLFSSTKPVCTSRRMLNSETLAELLRRLATPTDELKDLLVFDWHETRVTPAVSVTGKGLTIPRAGGSEMTRDQKSPCPAGAQLARMLSPPNVGVCSAPSPRRSTQNYKSRSSAQKRPAPMIPILISRPSSLRSLNLERQSRATTGIRWRALRFFA